MWVRLRSPTESDSFSTLVYLEHWVKRKYIFFERTLRSKTKGSSSLKPATQASHITRGHWCIVYRSTYFSIRFCTFPLLMTVLMAIVLRISSSGFLSNSTIFAILPISMDPKLSWACIISAAL